VLVFFSGSDAWNSLVIYVLFLTDLILKIFVIIIIIIIIIMHLLGAYYKLYVQQKNCEEKETETEKHASIHQKQQCPPNVKCRH